MSAVTTVPNDLDVFERRLVRDARRWLNHERGLMDRSLGGASSRARRFIDRALDNDAVKARLRTATDEVVQRLSGSMEGRLADVEPPRPHRDPSSRVPELRRIEALSDPIVTRYVGAMAAEGVAAGVASLTPVSAALSFLPDLAAALALSTQASAHLLVLYGVTPPGPAAVEAALQVAAVATDSQAEARRGHFLDLTRRLEQPIPSRPSPEEVSRLITQQAGTRALRETVEQTLRRIARRRLTVFIPLVGIAVHGAASGWLAGQVCEASRHLGRVVYLTRSTDHTSAQLLGIATD